MNGKGFLGTNASLLADLTLVTSLAVAILLTIGVVMAVRKRYTVHRWIQTTAVVLNAALVLLVMIGSFFKSAAPGIPEQLDQPYYTIALIHGLIGLTAFLFGSFVALRGNELVPSALKFNNYKLFMRIAYGLYMIATALGVWVYVTWYGDKPPADPVPSAIEGEATVPMANFVFNPTDMVIPAGTTVIWVNQDGAPHSATADGGLFDSGLLNKSEVFSFTFDTVGEFAYYCELHGSPGGADMAGIIKVVAPGEATAPAAAVPATPTTAAPPALVPAQPLGQPAGVAAFRDGVARNDQVVLEINLPAAPAAGNELAAFLMSADETQARPLGPLTVGADNRGRLEYSAADGANLFADFTKVVISEEPAGSQSASPTGRRAFISELPPESAAALRQLLVSGPLAPSAQGYAAELDRQTQELLRHAQFVADAQGKGDTDSMRRHAEHVFNLLAGSRDPNFGDLNGDRSAQNPGDGFGVLPNGEQVGYVKASADAAAAAGSASDATQAINVHAGHVQICAANVEQWSIQARELAFTISQTTDPTTAAPLAAELLQLSGWIYNGHDADGDGFITPTAGECGAHIAYEHSQYMAGFGLTIVP